MMVASHCFFNFFSRQCTQSDLRENRLNKVASEEFFFSKTSGSATVLLLVHPNVVGFSTTQIHPVVEIEGRPSSKPTHAQMKPHFIITVAEPFVIDKNSLIYSHYTHLPCNMIYLTVPSFSV